MSSSVGAQDVKLTKLRGDAMRGKWSEVFETCKQNKALYIAKITGTGDTVLHMAVSNGQEKFVANMLDGDEVESWRVNIILATENDRKNTPLHLAAVNGNVEICKKIAGRDPCLIARCNIAGETPLFLAALYGRKEAFLCLHYLYAAPYGRNEAFLWPHYLYMERPTNLAHCIRDDNDTILHCAIAEGHFDIAIEIVHLYKDHLKEMMRRNKAGLSPLHLLAAMPSAFETPALLERPFIVRSIYWSLTVKKKNQATTHEELQKKNQENRLVKLIKFKHSLLPFEFKHSLLPFVALFLLFVFFTPRNTLPLFFIVPLLLLCVQLVFDVIRKEKEKHTWSLQIMNKLLYHCSDQDMSQRISGTSSKQLSISLQRVEFNDSESMASPLSGRITIDTPLMIAVKNGVVEMVEGILELFPSRIKDVTAEGKNIVLLAVEYRQTEVFRFFCQQKWLSQSLFGEVDKDGNNALHLAASLGVDIDWLNPKKINWFEFVKKSMPRGLSERFNKKMETPEEISRESHKELHKSKGEWAAKTSQACSMLSTLVASGAYAKCIDAPGGYDDKGYAIHRNNPVFKIFAISSLAALVWSLISLILFLSIIASPSQSVHSWRYVPIKLYAAGECLFIAIVCLWVSSCAGHFFMLDDESIKSYISLIVLLSVIILPIVAQLLTIYGVIRSRWWTPIPICNATRPIEYRRTKTKIKENGTDYSSNNHDLHHF